MKNASPFRRPHIEPLETRIAPAFTGGTFDLSVLGGSNGTAFHGVAANDQTGHDVRAAGDVNGDGFGDFIVGTSQTSGGNGVAYVVFGRADGFDADETLDGVFLNGFGGFKIVGEANLDQAGYAASGAGDVNGDGFDDVIVGSPSAGGGAGAAYVIFGKAEGFGAQVSLSSLDGATGFKLTGTGGSAAGVSVSGAGDVNGDGFDEVIVGAYQDGGTGAAYVILGKAKGFAANLSLGSLNAAQGAKLAGAASGDNAGVSVSGAGDVNGDGFADMVVGAIRADGGGSESGAAYVVFGNGLFGGSISLGSLSGTSGFVVTGAAAGDYAGTSVSGAGDVNGDGLADVIVGASGAGTGTASSSPGAAFIVFGNAAPFASQFSLGASGAVLRLDGGTQDSGGASVKRAGDVNGDGLDDLIVGATQSSLAGGTGVAYVVFGRADLATAPPTFATLAGHDGFKIAGEEIGARTASRVSGAGDVNGDGFADLLVGAPYSAVGGTKTGQAYLVYGGPSGVFLAANVSADGKTATFTDVDGDLVTIKTTKGTLIGNSIGLLARDPLSNHAQLTSLQLGAGFEGADITITAKRAAGGDGKVNVGEIFAPNVDLGNVKIGGDLGRIEVGDSDDVAALKSLTVGSMGLFGGRTSDTGIGLASKITGAVGAVKIAGDFAASIEVVDGATSQTAKVASFTVGGSIIGGALENSGSLSVSGSSGRLGAVKISGDLRGGSGRSSGAVVADIVASVTVGGSLIGGSGASSGAVGGIGFLGNVSIGGSLIGGSGFFSGAIFSHANIGAVKIAGDQICGDGFSGGVVSIYGTGDIASVTIGGDARSSGGAFAGGVIATGKIGPVVIKGDVVGTAATPYIIAGGAAASGQSLAVTSLKVGGDFEHARVLAGSWGFAFSNGHAQIGTITVGGDWIASSASAGLRSDATSDPLNSVFGNGDDVFIAGGPDTIASIKSVTIKGAARGTFEDGDRYGIVAEMIGSVSIGGKKLALTKSTTADPANDLAAIHVGATPDFVVREVSRTAAQPAESFVATLPGDAFSAFPAVMVASTLPSFDAATFSGLANLDHLGTAVSDVGDVNGDGFDDFVISARTANLGGTDRGELYVAFGKAGGLSGGFALSTLDGTNGFKFSGTVDSAEIGLSLSRAGDVNGDGFGDLIVGTNSVGAAFRGEAYVIFGNASFAATLSPSALDGLSGFKITASTNSSYVGESVAGAGDVNGDGFDDVVVGAASGAYLVFGKKDGFAASLNVESIDGSNGVKLTAAGAGNGAVSGAGDVNGDGFDDVMVGAPNAVVSGLTTGAAWVLFGNDSLSGTAAVNLDALAVGKGFKLQGVANADSFGVSVSGAGDVNGDGFADVIVGANHADQNGVDSGAAYVVFGSASVGSAVPVSSLNGLTGFKMRGVSAGDLVGGSVRGAGDVNGDGFADIIVGAERADEGGSNRGAAYVVFGRSGFTASASVGFEVSLGGLTGSEGFKITGTANDDALGFAVSSAGDVNGDGYADIVTGAIKVAAGGTERGAAYVIYGGPSGEFIAPTLSADFKTAMWTDVDGDLVTLKVSKGTLDTSNFRLLAKSTSDSRAQLLALNIAGSAEFDGADITLTAKRAGGGDGKVNLGSFLANGLDLGAVKIGGDLGRMFAGDLDDGPGFKSLTIDSAGLFGGRTQDTLGSNEILIAGPAGPVKVAGDVRGVLLFSQGAALGTGKFASITIGGSLIGGTRINNGVIAAGTLGPVKIGGDLAGGTQYGTGFLQANVMSSVTIGGSMIGGSGLFSGAVQSFGPLGDVKIGGSQLGGTGAASGSFFISGDIGKIDIKHDQIGRGDSSGLIYTSGGSIASVTVGGDARAGDAAFAGGILAGGTLGPVSIKGDVIGTAQHAYTIRGSGPQAGTTSVAIASLKVGGDLDHALILGGFGQSNGATNGHAQIGAITVGGDWIASSVSAGVLPHLGATNAAGSFGNDDDAFIAAGPAGVIASIARITIKGRVTGTLEGGDRFGIVAEQIGTVKIGGVQVALTPGASNDLAGIGIGSTPDFRIGELARI